jgi:hypothetical protein
MIPMKHESVVKLYVNDDSNETWICFEAICKW